MILVLHLSLFTDASVAAGPGIAQNGTTMEFDIPSQSLGMALQRYANDTGTSIFFDSAFTAGKSSMPVRGRYAVEDALRHLLAGSGLEAQHTSATSFTVVVSAQAPSQDISPDIAATAGKLSHDLDGERARLLQRALERALCKSPQTRPGRYRALIRFSLNRDGHVRGGAVLGTTGLVERDSAINRLLSTLIVAGLPAAADVAQQPFTVLLLPQSDGMTDVCAQMEEAD